MRIKLWARRKAEDEKVSFGKERASVLAVSMEVDRTAGKFRGDSGSFAALTMLQTLVSKSLRPENAVIKLLPPFLYRWCIQNLVFTLFIALGENLGVFTGEGFSDERSVAANSRR